MNKMKEIFSKLPSWWGFVVLLAVGGIIVWFAPDEATLGSGIKTVYVHVPLTIVAKPLLYLAAGLGVLGLLWQERLERWGWVVYRVGLGMFFAGFLFSMLASKINWGNVPLQESRFLKAANVSVVGIAVWLLVSWIPWARVRGAMLALPPLFFITLSLPSTWELHPETAMRTAPGAIGATFVIMLGWAALVALWGLWYLYASEMSLSNNDLETK